MMQFDPPHPGGFIRRTYLEPFGISAREVAEYLHVSPSTFSRVVSGKSRITPDMAIRLSKVLGRSPQSWLQMQMNYDLWQSEQTNSYEDLKELELV